MRALATIFPFVLASLAFSQVAVTPEMKAEAARLDQACAAKNAQACFDLARMHWKGEVTGWRDDKKGIEAFLKAMAIDSVTAVASQRDACDDGNAIACHDLGLMHAGGLGMARDGAKAAQRFREACDAGSAAGCTHLGTLYASGESLPRDDAKAARLFQRACDGRDARGCFNLGTLYFTGEGVPKDKAKGAQLFQKACALGEKQTCRPAD